MADRSNCFCWCIPQCGLAPYYNNFKCLTNQIDGTVYGVAHEVCLARGSCCSLDGRLSVALNPDGTLKTALSVDIKEKGTLHVIPPREKTLNFAREAISLTN